MVKKLKIIFLSLVTMVGLRSTESEDRCFFRIKQEKPDIAKHLDKFLTFAIQINGNNSSPKLSDNDFKRSIYNDLGKFYETNKNQENRFFVNQTTPAQIGSRRFYFLLLWAELQVLNARTTQKFTNDDINKAIQTNLNNIK